MRKIKVLLIESEHIGTHIKKKIQEQPDIFVVELMASRELIRQHITQGIYDIILMDLWFALSFIEKYDLILYQGHIKTILLSSEKDGEWISSAIQAGMINIVLHSSYENISFAIRDAYSGRRYNEVKIMEILSQEISRLKKIEGKWILTRSEQEILELIGQGYSRKQIMEYLHVSEGAVKNHVFHAIKKMKVKNGKEAAALAKRKGWIS